ncbi:MAG: GNAT family N-acetyltransferase [Coriobacteriales bacterium]
MRPLFADAELASRLEGFAARENERLVAAARTIDPDSSATSMRIAGGSAVFVGGDGAMNHAAGLGFSGPVRPSDIDDIEAFYSSRGLAARVSVCPLADPSVWLELSRRGYQLTGFENVLVLVLAEETAPGACDDHVTIREAGPDMLPSWAESVAAGFAAPAEPTEQERAVATLAAHEPGALLYLAYVDGKPVGTGELTIDGEIGWLSADTTLPPFRGRGIQSAMQRRRIALARAAGCELAVTESSPGSASQRNMERLGFRVVYTRVNMTQWEPVKHRAHRLRD